MTDPLESHLLGQAERADVGFWHQLRARAVVDQVPDRSGVVVADIGAGAGLLGRTLRDDRPRAGYRFFEPLSPLRDHLTAVYGETSRMADANDVDGADVIVALDVIEHIDDDRGFLGEIVGRAKPGTTIVLTVPALPFLWSSWDVQLGHHRRYTRDSLRAVVADLDVDELEISYLFPELLPPGLLRRLLRGHLGSGRTEEFPELPRALDRLLFGLGLVTYRARRVMPVGTSLLCVARRR